MFPREWPPLAAKMFSVGLLGFMSPESVPEIGGQPAAAEFCGVPAKVASVLRLILDRRRRNATDCPLAEVLKRSELYHDALLLACLLRLLTLPLPRSRACLFCLMKLCLFVH